MDELLDFLASLDIEPPARWSEKVLSLYRSLVRANERLNLTRITQLDDFLFKHVADSLLVAAAWPAIRDAELDLADVGCGGGLPGLALALTFPQLSVSEIDASRKKIAAVAGFIGELGLSPSSRAIPGRARELAARQEYQGAFDVVLARAVAGTPDIIRECRRLLRPRGGTLISYKTPKLVREEKRLVLREAAKASLTASESETYRLPAGRGERQFWILEKRHAPER